jgi:hypothetical protein
VIGLPSEAARTPYLLAVRPPGRLPAGTRCAESSISVRHRSETDIFFGDVDSHMDYCTRRVVALRRVRKGGDVTVATTETNRQGRWRITFNVEGGRFYAAARFKGRSSFPDGADKCYRARSEIIRVD